MLKLLKNNTDVIYKETDANCIICYQEQLCNILEFMKDFYPRIKENLKSRLDILFPGICKEIKEDQKLIEQMIFSGLLISYRNFVYYAFDLSKAPTRKTSDSIAEPENIFGSRDGFVENFKDNIALIRTRVKTNSLDIKTFMLGRRSKTNVSLLSIKDIHNQEIKEKISEILDSIDVDAILTLDDISAYFQGNNLFPVYQYVGSPDMTVRRLLNGEFVIIVDRLACVIILPMTLGITSRLMIDNMNLPFSGSIFRLFTFFMFFFATIFLGLIASFTTFQSDSLSLRLLSILKFTQKGVVFPVSIEIILVLSIFELFYLIGFRQSKLTISTTVIIVGGLIIGENLVTSGFTGVFIMTLTAICFLMTFVISTNATVIATISLLRLFVLVSSFYYGLFGVVLASIFVVYIFFKQKLFDVHYFYPFVPLDWSGIKRFFTPTSKLKQNTRDEELNVKNKVRRKL